jgi:hypothetical protein
VGSPNRRDDDVKQLAVTVGDVDGDGKREVPKGSTRW